MLFNIGIVRGIGLARWATIGGVLLASVWLMLAPRHSLASDQLRAKKIIQETCVQCHRLKGGPDSRFNLKAPDLIWAGSKYQRPWFVRWMSGKEPPLYAKNYRWDLTTTPAQHPVVSESDASAMFDYLVKNNKDARVKIGGFDLAKVTKFDVAFGGAVFKAHACIGCHTVIENDKLVGGPQSTNLAASGQRYNADWLFRFGQNPQNFTMHNGEFLADATDPQLRAVIGFLMVQGVAGFKYYEPWMSHEFATANAARGKVIYKEYCSQCHGITGKGDGPAASGLEPKPAIHANIPFEKLPMEYVYNVVNHGGPAIGKSANMPYWNLTIGQQGVADVIAYLKATFKGPTQPEVSDTVPHSGKPEACVQPRKTMTAPADFLSKTNPLPVSAEAIQAGEALFLKTAKPAACAMCHGDRADGKGVMGAALMPPPRNFTCGPMMADIPDGQLFWVIKNGSPGTGMMAFSGLPDEQVWQLIHYIRSLAR